MADLVDMSQRLRETATLHGWTGSLPANSMPALLVEAATELEALRKRCEALESSDYECRAHQCRRQRIELQARCKAVEADAERWKWLRERASKLAVYSDVSADVLINGEWQDKGQLDATVTTHIAAAQEPSHG